MLLLDIGGVLLTNGWDRHMRSHAAEQFGLDYADLDDRHGTTFDSFERGHISLETYLRRVVFHRPRDFSPEEFKEFMFAQSRPLPGMLEFFREVKRQNALRVAAVSNEGRELTEMRIRRFGLATLMDFFICSCFVHCRKPDEAIFRLALDTLQVAPEQALYIDDRPQLVEVAQSLGLHSFPHRNLETTRTALAGYGLTMPAFAERQ